MLKRLSCLLCLMACAVSALAEPGLHLRASSGDLGVMRAVTSKGVTFVAFDDVIESLGGQGTVSKDTYDVTYKIHQLRLIHNSTAAWLDGSILALARAPQVAKGHCWVEKETALKVAAALLAEEKGRLPLQWGALGERGSAAAPKAEKAAAPFQPAPVETATPAPAPAPAQGVGPAVTQLRFGDNGDFYRLVLDVDGEAEIPLSAAAQTLSLRADTRSLTVLPDMLNMAAVQVDHAKAGSLSLTTNGPLKYFWLKEPRRLVVDWQKGGAPLAAVAPKPAGVPAAQKPAPAKEESPVPAKVKEPPKEKPQQAKAVDTPPQITPPLRKGKKPFVMIDPGHGGKDTGATRGKYQEKVIALQIAQKLQKALSVRGIDSRLTREGDTYPTLSERPAMANALRADAFVSIHLNSLATKSGSARGQEIYIMALPSDKDAERLAKLENAEITESGKALVDSGQTNMLISILGNMRQNAKIEESTALAEGMYNEGAGRGIKMRRVAQAPFAVLRGAAMPAVLVETGFITHPEEVQQLASPGYQTKLAEAMANGLQQYLKSILP